MVRNFGKRGFDVWVHCCCRGLPGDDGTPAVIRRLYIDHEAPVSCRRATLQYKSVPDCGAIQKNSKRCKKRTEFRSRARLLALSNKVKRAQGDILVGGAEMVPNGIIPPTVTGESV